jgi:hypothetical protein
MEEFRTGSMTDAPVTQIKFQSKARVTLPRPQPHLYPRPHLHPHSQVSLRSNIRVTVTVCGSKFLPRYNSTLLSDRVSQMICFFVRREIGDTSSGQFLYEVKGTLFPSVFRNRRETSLD